jgi:hypothetical protein
LLFSYERNFKISILYQAFYFATKLALKWEMEFVMEAIRRVVEEIMRIFNF